MIGLPGSGTSTIFQLLTQVRNEERAQKGALIGTVQVPDRRVDTLSELFKPKKTVYAHMEYLLPEAEGAYGLDGKGTESFWSDVRPCDALIHVVRNFHLPGGDAPSPRDDLLKIEGDMLVADLVVVEKRIQNIELDRKRGKQINDQELRLLEECLKVLGDESPLRDHPELALAPLLKGYALLSAKLVLTLFNNDDEDETLPPWVEPPKLSRALVVRGRLESELAQLPAEEAAEFSTAYHVEGSAVDRTVRHSCDLLGLISFFTVVHDEVHAWLVRNGVNALDAAGVIHSDMKKGFIRAEVLAYEDLTAAGTYQQAKRDAKVRLEGKEYVVQDGDVIYFRFNV